MNTVEHYTTRSTCRVCDKELFDLFELGEQYVSTFLDKPTAQCGELIKAPITLCLCDNCKLVQLRHTARQDFLYSLHYWYRSGVTDTMRAALRDITQEIEQEMNLQAGDVVLDIGSNDGTLLRSYAHKDIIRVGVEPAKNLAKEGAAGLHYFFNGFWNFADYWSVLQKKAKVITAIGMFYDLEDPLTFVGDIAKALAPDGVFIAQLMLCQNMLRLRDVGNLAHEHLEFYTMASLDYMLGQVGLEIFDLDVNAVNGESTRLYIRHIGGPVAGISGSYHRVKTFAQREADYENLRPFSRFFNDAQANKERCVRFIADAFQRGKKTFVYGASTKGNVILQYYGLCKEVIPFAAERSPEKWGKFTVGTDIEILPEVAAMEQNPDYLLALPYAFIDEFTKREQKFMSAGGHFLVPLPEFKVR